MSNWDFGYGQPPAEHHEPQQPQYPYPQQPQQPYPQYPYQQQPEGPGGAGFLPDDAGWSDDGGWPDADGYLSGSGEAYDPRDAPYPITYERDEFEGHASGPGAGPSFTPWPAAPDPAERFNRDPFADGTQAWYPQERAHYPDGQAGYPQEQPQYQDGQARYPGGQPGGEPWLRQREERWDDEAPPAPPRWLIPAVLAVAGAAVGAVIVLLAAHSRAPAPAGSGAPSTPASPAAIQAAAPSAAGAPSSAGAAAATPLTLAAAQGVLGDYTAANNSANATRSDATLATIETGGSYAIDAGLYTIQAAAGTAPYPAFAPVAATYYIPRAEPGGGPRWFVVQVANAFTANPKQVTSTEYLLFTQATPGGRWQNAVEPYLLAGVNAPQVAVGDGLATAVSATATSLAVAPGLLAGRTAESLDGAGAGVRVADPTALADRSDQLFWRGKVPTATVTDAHTAATGSAGQTFALLTTDGGALVFYTDAAEVAITPPTGSVVHLTVPGLYSPAQALPGAGLSYLDQFAAYDPPAGAGTPTVVAEYSGITGKN
jgi:hypothetical protein